MPRARTAPWLAALHIIVLELVANARAARVTFARSENETRWVHRPPAAAEAAADASFLQTAEPYVEQPKGWRTWQPNSDEVSTANGMSNEDRLQRSMFKGLTDLNNEQLNPINIKGPKGMFGEDQHKYVKNIDDSAPQGSSGKKKPPGGPLEWRQMPELRGVGGVERKAATNVAATTYEVGRYRVGEQCTHAASAQFRNSKRLTITFMNNRFGGRMPPLVLVTVHKPRTDQAWDHAYNANVIDVTPNGFVVEVSRLDKDAGWCYELDLLWMAYGFATGDEQAIGRDPELYEPM